MDFWDQIYQLLRIRNFIYFIDSPSVQAELFGVKLIFILFSVVFLTFVIYFYAKSSYLKFQFVEDTQDFLTWHAYGFREVDKRWRRIMAMLGSTSPADWKLAIVEADDFLRQMMEEKDFEGETFEEIAASTRAARNFNYALVMDAHAIRNSIVRDPSYSLDENEAKRLMLIYEEAIRAVISA